MKRTIVFIDGQNLHFALQDMALQEKDIHWEALFRYIMPSDHELIRLIGINLQELLRLIFFLLSLKEIARMV